MTVTVELTTGLPGSGKTTYAKQRINESDGLRRVNLDDLRHMLDDGVYTKEYEQTALKIQDQIVVQAVREGYDVIVDNTHLHKRIPERIRAALAPYDVTWKVHNFLDVPVSECVRRDLERKARGERSVGADVIQSMARKRRTWTLTEDFLTDYYKPEVYKPRLLARRAIICDLDGTLAIHRGRSPYDTARCGEDAADSNVATVLDLYSERAGVYVILLSGRSEEFRAQTEEWLYRWGIEYNTLLMRPAGDSRRDDIVKAELFDQHIRDNYHVLFALDDRNRVVNMWRRIGLPTWQVAEGDF